MTCVTITVRPVGMHYGCEAMVRYRANRRVLHVTRLYPHGMEAQARKAAEEWAWRHHYAADQLVHLFSQGRYATALCGASNADDGDAPASETLAEVTCEACKVRARA